MNVPKPAGYLPADQSFFRYIEKSSPWSSNLEFLTCGIYELSGRVTSGLLAHPSEEALLFCWKGAVGVNVDKGCRMDTYDVVYIPRGMTYRLEQAGGESRIVLCRAPAENTHPFFHASWSNFSKDEKRIRRLKGRDVFLMFDVTEPADKLVAGYTIFRPFQRGYPPHNHSDQEEIYVFIRGHGSMEVYADEETKSLVCSVAEGDAVTIPVLNYHPVFSREEELHFIWCIAGNRYWIGDRHNDFMTGNVDKLTT